MFKLFLLILALVIIGLTPAFCMWLWNWLMPSIFGLRTIGYWEALGLMVLASFFTYRPTSSSKSK